ncbi:unnamed protein product [Gongylonema pulchrum]|uniref:SEC7 domain-containing protein n=1 Tax=Gongylonema pulchrum TaxID=637853 RepID=A0A183DSM7_9BILA|nr:unnamed protein product [Gongylonema pulchrum]
MLGEWRGPTISVRTLTSYEISDELTRRQLQVSSTSFVRIADGSPLEAFTSSLVLERRYGGRLRAHTAATRIQRAFRQSRLLQQWKRLVVPIQSGALRLGHDSGRGYGDAYGHSSNSLTNLAISQAYGSRCPTAPTRAPCSLPRGALLPIEQDVEVPSTIGENGDNAKHRGGPFHRSAVDFHCCLSEKVWNTKHIICRKPTRGIQLLIELGFVEDSSLAVANLLLGRRGLSKQMIGEYLGYLHSPFQSSVLKHFVGLIDLHGMEVDVALRHALSFFRLPGEAQKIERIMQVFSAHYATCNPEKVALFRSAETLFILAFAIVMLNTDLHSPNIKPSRKMKLDDFINNLRGIDAGYDIDRALLVRIYCRIRDSPLRTGSDHVSQVLKVDQSIVGKDKPKLVEPYRRLVCYCRLNQVMDRSKRQAVNAHQREVFLFNDLLLISKLASKRKSCCQYVLRSWITLLGVRVDLFEAPFYEHGITISSADGQEIHLNSKSGEDRYRFVADVRESAAECAEMEAVRIEIELDKHSLISRNDGQRERAPSDSSQNIANCVINASPQQALCSVRRLSFNSFDSGVVEESCESFSHSALSPVTSFLTSKHLEAAI